MKIPFRGDVKGTGFLGEAGAIAPVSLSKFSFDTIPTIIYNDIVMPTMKVSVYMRCKND